MSNQSSRKEFLNNETIFHYLQSMYEELLEKENLTTDDILAMNTIDADNFWNRFEIYAFDVLGYINLTPTVGMKSAINKQINNDYLNQINICDIHYKHYEHYVEVVSYYFCNNETEKNDFKQALTEPKIGTLK
jgi:hypothetical protein